MVIQDFVANQVGLLTVEGSSPAQAPTFIHGNEGWQNLLADEVMNDIIFLDEPVSSNDTYAQGGLLTEAYALSLLFLTKSELDYTPEQHKPLIARMRRLRLAFIQALSRSGLLLNKNYQLKTIDVVNVLNVNMTGCLVSITITPIDPQPRC